MPNIIDGMVEDVKRMQEGMPVPAVEGEDYQAPSGAPAPPEPQPVPEPEIVAVDLKSGRIFTTIGQFEISGVESAKVARICLRPIKQHLNALYRKISSNGPKIARKPKAVVKPKRRYRRKPKVVE
jgi:hypothetical protein